MTTTTKYGWWRMSGWNQQAVYGYGSEAEAWDYCKRVLNEGRESSLYSPTWLGETDEAAQAECDANNHGVGCIEDAGINLADALAEVGE